MITPMTTNQPMATCDNCGRNIGKLEPRYIWQNHTVCGECFARLSTPIAPPVASAPTAPVAAPAAASVQTPAAHAEPAAVPPEIVLFDGHPSLLTALGAFVLATVLAVVGLVTAIGGLFVIHQPAGHLLEALGGILVFAGVALGVFTYLKIKFIHYRLSSQRLFITTGILSKKIVEVELFRVRDLSVSQTLVQRMLGIGEIRAVTTDADIPLLKFDGIRNPLKVKELLRQHVMESRQRTRTRDLDISDLPGTI